jgi:ribosomal protein S18 acetylase RimI-like enzyme
MYLRKATKEDEVILKSWLKNKRDCLLVTNKGEYSSEDYFKWLEADDQHGYFLVDDAGAILGYGEIWVDEEQKDIELAHLIINPIMRNKGRGKTLIGLLEEKAKLFKFPIIYMRVNPENQQAVNCYTNIYYEIDFQLNEAWGNKWTWLKKVIN